MKLNILGVEYTLITDGKIDDFPDLEGSDGYCNYQLKKLSYQMKTMMEQSAMTGTCRKYYAMKSCMLIYTKVVCTSMQMMNCLSIG